MDMDNSMKENTLCATCGSTTEANTVTYEHTIGDRHVLVTGVPAYVCTQCGNSNFDFAVAVQLEKLLDDGSPVRTVQTPVYEFLAAPVSA
jgi:YgiT-type zinc finger domain-containing protein